MHNAYTIPNISRLTLGTVQLGMPYGVANVTGPPDYPTARAMLAMAVERGITCFDTAPIYGGSEALLGRALRELRVLDNVTLVTKVLALTDEQFADPAAAANTITASVDASRERLGLDCLPVVLFHAERDQRYLDVLSSLREQGRVGGIGVSLASPLKQPLTLDARVEAIQAPANLADRWPRDPGMVAEFQRPGLAVFIRSVYLKGLLLLPAETLPETLASFRPVRRKLSSIAAEGGLSDAEMALRFAMGLDFADSVIVGAETADQLRANLDMAEKGPLPADVLGAIEEATRKVSDFVLTPGRWSGMSQGFAPAQSLTPKDEP